MNSKTNGIEYDITKDVYTANAVFASADAETLVQYINYCIETGLITSVDNDGTQIDHPLLMELLVAKTIEIFIKLDKNFASWIKANKDKTAEANLEEYFTINKSKKEKEC